MVNKQNYTVALIVFIIAIAAIVLFLAVLIGTGVEVSDDADTTTVVESTSDAQEVEDTQADESEEGAVTESGEAEAAEDESTETEVETDTPTVSYGVNSQGDNIYLRTYSHRNLRSGNMLNEIAGIIIEQHEEDCDTLNEIYSMLEEINNKLDSLIE